MAACRACGELLPDVGQLTLPGFVDGDCFECKCCPACGTMQTSTGDAHRLDELYSAIYTQASVVSGYKRYRAYAALTSHPLMRHFFSVAHAEDIYMGALTFLKKLDRKPSELKVLEVGSGLGYTTALLARQGYRVVGTDFNRQACEDATRRYGNEFICGSLDDVLHAHGRTFDAIVCLEVIEHVDDPYAFIQDMKRLLKPGGCLIMSTPTCPGRGAWETTEPPIHTSYFSPAGIERLAARVGAQPAFLRCEKRYPTRGPAHRNEELGTNLPGGVLTRALAPNPEYFDNGQLCAADYARILARSLARRLLAPLRKYSIARTATDVESRSQIFRLTFAAESTSTR